MGFDPSRRDVSIDENDPVQVVNWYHAIAFCNKLSILEGRKVAYEVEGIKDWQYLAYTSIPLRNDEKWNNVTCNWEADGYRLPTEMEWMWAAMGAPLDGQYGNTNTTGYLKRFSGDDGKNNIGDYVSKGAREIEPGGFKLMTHRIASKRSNELGIFDMSGNVWEWCWDWYASKNNSYTLNGIEDQAYKVSGTVTDYRGGQYSDYKHKVIRGGGYFPISKNDYVLTYRLIGTTVNGCDTYGFRVARTK